MKFLNQINRNDIEKFVKSSLKEKDALIRKAKKLQRDPELFFKDMYEKRRKQLVAKIPVKYEGQNQFTVISAVYNVEKYLDEYFSSLVNQTLDFKKHIQVIMVDDGSTDTSAKIIKKWQKKFPNNIHYYYKENGGQASARDYGLDYVKTEWCTFIDPDDFIDNDYFRNIDLAIEDKKDLLMISCNLIYYYEQSKQFKDNHPQNYKFRQAITYFDSKDSKQYIQLSVSLSILKTNIIKENHIRFDTRIRPSFEDATFMMNYALALYNNQGSIAFIRDSKYYYRKREDGTSTLDTGWTKPSGYNEVLQYGCLSTLKKYQSQLGYVPQFIQTSIMYYHIWQIKQIVNHKHSLDFLTKNQKAKYLSLLREIFEYIDEDVIDGFGLAGAWFFHKAGMLNLYKNQAPRPDLQIVYIEKYDAVKNQILMYYFAPKNSMAIFYNQEQLIEPAHFKILRHSFLDEAFVYEYRYWIPLSENGSISVHVDGNPTKIGFAGSHIRTPITVANIKKYYNGLCKYLNIENSWVIIDRDVQADDNAEHFYRYVMNNHPEQKAYFALRQSSHDWNRLEKEGFNLLDFGTPQFENVLRSCSKIISSHIDDYIIDYFQDKGLIGKDFIFLPHGVTQNDLHEWYNSKIQNLSLMTVATNDEYHSIVDNNNHYKYSKKEIKLTGFPRHDALLHGNKVGTKRIIIMPTWRKYLTGKYDNNTGKFLRNPDFMQSEYAIKWQTLLQSKELQDLIYKYGYEVIFAPHKNSETYIDDFRLPKYIQIWQANHNQSIQRLFQTSDIMITDYSSVAFEMAYLGKPVLYYQFDFDMFFRGQWQRGYFDYKQNGFGAVSDNQTCLLSDLEDILRNNGKALSEYQYRIDNTFAYRDNNNCKRVYQEIVGLDHKFEQSKFYSKKFTDYLTKYAHKYHIWHLIERLNLEKLNQKPELLLRHKLEQEVCRAMFMQGKYQSLIDFLSNSNLKPAEKQYWKMRLDFWVDGLEKTSDYSENHPAKTTEDAIIYLLAAARLQSKNAYQSQMSWLFNQSLEPIQKLMVEVSEAIFSQDNEKIIQLITHASKFIVWSQDDTYIYKPQIILANSAILLKDYDLSYSNIRQHNNRLGFIDYASNFVSAKMDYAKGSYHYAIEHFEILIKQGIALNIQDEYMYLKSLCYDKQYSKLNDPNLSVLISNNELLWLWIDLQIQHCNWEKIIDVVSELDIQKQSLHYPLVLSYYRSGRIDDAYSIIRKPTYKDEYKYWLIVMEIALLKDDLLLAKTAYQGLVSIYPEKISELQKKFDCYLSIRDILCDLR